MLNQSGVRLISVDDFNRSEKSVAAYDYVFKWKEKNIAIALGLFYLVALALSYFIFLRPKSTYVHIYLNDVFALLNGAYRVFHGQVPYIDFHTVYGPFVFYIPALGLRAGLAPAEIFAFDSVIVAAFTLLAAGLTMFRRFSLPVALTTLVFLWLLTVVPIPSGLAYLSWGTFYNRHGWAALAIVLLFYVEPRNPGRSGKWIDSLILASLSIFLLYMKLTFGVAAVAFLAANAVTSKYNRNIFFISFAMVAVLVIFAEIIFGGGFNRQYIENVFSVPTASIKFLFGPRHLAYKLIEHSWIILACIAAPLAALMAGRRSYFDWAYALGAFAGSVALLELTGGTTRGLPALIAVFVCCGELARRAEPAGDPIWRNHAGSLACFLLALMFISEPVSTRAMGLFDYYHNTHGAVRPVPGLPTALSGYLVPEASPETQDILGDESGHELLAKYRLLNASELSAREYLLTVADGATLLGSVATQQDTLFVLDNADPFTIALNLKLAKNAYPMLWGELFTAVRHPQPQEMFSGVDLIMYPFQPCTPDTFKTLWDIYGGYIDREFVEIKRSRYWRLLARKS